MLYKDEPLALPVLLTGEICLERGGKDPTGTIFGPFIHFGNTGYTVAPEYPEGRRIPIWVAHFTPEGAEDKGSGYEEKYKAVYSFALCEVVKWWENPVNFDLLTRPNLLTGTTNQRFYRYNERLLGPEIYELVGKPDSRGQIDVRFHLDKLAGTEY